MPLIYSGRCDSCGEERRYTDLWLAVALDSGEEEVLPHPGESATLARLGLTRAEVEQSGRLRRYVRLICPGCGIDCEHDADDPLLREEPRPPSLPDRIAFVGYVVLPILLVTALMLSTEPGLSKAALFLPALVGGLLVAVFFHRVVEDLFGQDRPSTARYPPCVHCGTTLESLRPGTFPCPNCREGHIVTEFWGKS